MTVYIGQYRNRCKVPGSWFGSDLGRDPIWRHFVVVATKAQFHSTKSVLKFYTSSNPARGVSEICDGENPWQWSRLEIRRKRLSPVNHSAKAIHYHHQIYPKLGPKLIIFGFQDRNSKAEYLEKCSIFEDWTFESQDPF